MDHKTDEFISVAEANGFNLRKKFRGGAKKLAYKTAIVICAAGPLLAATYTTYHFTYDRSTNVLLETKVTKETRKKNGDHVQILGYTIFVFLTSTGANTYTVPADWNSSSNLIEAVGGGGNGAQGSGSRAGGHGGTYASVTNISLSGSVNYNISAGSTGDTWISNTGVAPTGTTEGPLAKPALNSTTGCIGSVVFAGGTAGSAGASSDGGGGAAGPGGKGGNGGVSAGVNSGGGGGGAGSTAAGSDGSAPTGGTGGATGGGAGGAGSPSSPASGGNGTAGTNWSTPSSKGSGGGGGGGRGLGSNQGGDGGLYGGGGGGLSSTGGLRAGNGAQGILRISYTPNYDTFVYLTTTGANTWTVPTDFNNSSNLFECVGGGGNGVMSNGGANVGGAGGTYAMTTNMTLTPGGSASYNISAGNTGDTWISNTGSAPGSSSAGALAKPALNSTTGCIGVVTFAGGTSGAVNFLRSGGGGGAAGPGGKGGNGGTPSGAGTQPAAGGGGAGSTAAGGDASTATPGTGGATGGGGGGSPPGVGANGSGTAGTAGTNWATPSSKGSGGGGGGGRGNGNVGGAGALYGGGGGGQEGTTNNAGAGAQGIIRISYIAVVNGGTHRFFMVFG